MSTTLGERIRAARENKDLLQADLAKMIGVKSAGVISNWEKDLSKPDANKLVRLCKALDVSASYLLDYYGDEDFEVLPHEINIIKDFRNLDSHGKEVVLYLLRKELQRCSASQPCAKMIEMGTREIPSMVAEPVSPYMAGRIGSYESASTAQLDPGVSHEEKIKSLIDGSAPESSIIEMNNETGEQKIEAIPLNESDLQEDPDSSLTIKGAERDINRVISETDLESKKARAKTKA